MYLSALVPGYCVGPTYCGICYSEFPPVTRFVQKKVYRCDLNVKPNDFTPTELKCHHVFHANCIHNYLATYRDTIQPPDCFCCSTELLEAEEAQTSSSSSLDLTSTQGLDKLISKTVVENKRQLYVDLQKVGEGCNEIIALWVKVDEQLQASVVNLQQIADQCRSDTTSFSAIQKFDIGPWRDGINNMKLNGFEFQEYALGSKEIIDVVKRYDSDDLRTIRGLQRLVIRFQTNVNKSSMQRRCVLEMVGRIEKTTQLVRQTPSAQQPDFLKQSLPFVLSSLDHHLRNVIHRDFNDAIKTIYPPIVLETEV